MTLTDDDRQVIVPLWARAMVETHIPRVGTYGESCDELGCIVCNMGTDLIPELISDYFKRDRHHSLDGLLPDDEELLDAAEAWLVHVRGERL